MTRREFEICEIARLVHERESWEFKCKGCKHLEKAYWEFGGEKGHTYSCAHPERQGQYDDPRPYGCGGYKWERK